MNKCGVYQIKSKNNDKIYVGQSIDIERRWNQHKYGKGNIILKNAIKKYGIDNFEFSILEEINTINKNKNEIKDELYQKEQYWFDILKPYENGFNINKKAKPNETSYSRGIEFGKKISKIKIENNHTCKPITQYDVEGNIIKEWSSASSVERELNFNARNVGGCANGDGLTAFGFIWRFKNDVLKQEDIDRIKNKRTKEKKVYQYDLKDNLIKVYNSVTEASKLTTFKGPSISFTCRGGWKTYHGFKWYYNPI